MYVYIYLYIHIYIYICIYIYADAPSVEARMATTARPPTNPKRRDTNPVTASTGSNWLNPAFPPLVVESTFFLRLNAPGVSFFCSSSLDSAAAGGVESSCFSSPAICKERARLLCCSFAVSPCCAATWWTQKNHQVCPS